MICPEFEILRLCIRLDDHGAAAEKATEIIRNCSVNWEELYTRANLHAVKPQLAGLIRSIPGTAVPHDFQDRIDEACRSNLYDQLRYAAEFLEIMKVLEVEGITAVPYKGFWFGHKYYGNMADREGGDIDLLISFRDLDRVMAVMPRLGYRTETSGAPRFIEKIRKESAEFNFDKYEDNRRAFHVEFHWKMGSSSHGLDISLDDLSPQIISGRLQGNEFPVFTPSANLLLAVMHHAGKDPLLMLKQVLDIGWILRKNNDIEWEWVSGKARRLNIEKGVYLCIRLASLLTGAEVPLAVREKVESAEIKRLAEGRISVMTSEPGWWYGRDYEFNALMFHLRLRNSLLIKSRMVCSYAKARAVGILAPKRLLKLYLKKRYDIDRELNQ